MKSSSTTPTKLKTKSNSTLKIELKPQDKVIDYIKNSEYEGFLKTINEIDRVILERFHSKYEKTALMVACEEGSIDFVQLLLDKGVTLDIMNNLGMNAFLYAIQNGYHNIGAILVTAGVNYDQINTTTLDNALMIACHYGRHKTVSYLLSHPFQYDLEYKNLHQETALFQSIKYEFYEIALQLLVKGADINTNGLNQNNLLSHAAFDGKLEMMRFVLEHHGDVTNKNDIGENCLHVACKNNQLEIVKIIFQFFRRKHPQGHDEQLDETFIINEQDHSVRTPLMLSCIHKNYSIASYLLRNSSKGMDVNVSDTWGYSALTHVCNHTTAQNEGICLQLIDLLMEYGAIVNQMDKCYHTPMMHVCKQDPCRVTVLRRLLHHGADLQRLTNINGKTALEFIKSKSVMDELTASRLLDITEKGAGTGGNLAGTGIRMKPLWMEKLNHHQYPF